MFDSTAKRIAMVSGIGWAVLYGGLLLTGLATAWGIGPDWYWSDTPRVLLGWWLVVGGLPLLIVLGFIWITSIKKSDS